MARRQRPRLENRTVVLTGAARGLGRQLAGEIGGSCSSPVLTIARDLLADNAPRAIFAALAEVPVHGLINNAGLTYYGETTASELPAARRRGAVGRRAGS